MRKILFILLSVISVYLISCQAKTDKKTDSGKLFKAQELFETPVRTQDQTDVIELRCDPIDTVRIAFIGLGIMGSNMASNLAKNNLNLTVYNRTPKILETIENSNISYAGSIKNAVKDADIVFSMLSTPQVVEEVFFGTEGALNSMKKNAIWADCTTVNPSFSKRAFEEASKYGTVNAIASSEDKMYSYIPDLKNLEISEDADYVHMVDNNTIFGTKFYELPDTKGKVLVNDASSCFLSEPMDVSKYGLIFAGAQKNVGPAGTVIVIIREDLIIKDHLPYTPIMLRYDIHAESKSMYNTPPTYGIYLCGKVFKWLLNLGGLEAIQYNII